MDQERRGGVLGQDGLAPSHGLEMQQHSKDRFSQKQYELLVECANLGKGAARWQQGREGWGKGEEILLEGADLEGLDLSGFDLSGGNSEEFLGNVILDRARLARTKLCKADLTDASLIGARLWKSDLRGASLRGARMDGTTLIWNCDVDRETDCHGVALESVTINAGGRQFMQYVVRKANWTS